MAYLCSHGMTGGCVQCEERYGKPQAAPADVSWRCQTCGGSMRKQSITAGAHRHHTDCIAHLLACQSQTQELLATAREVCERFPDSPSYQSVKRLREAIRKCEENQ